MSEAARRNYWLKRCARALRAETRPHIRTFLFDGEGVCALGTCADAMAQDGLAPAMVPESYANATDNQGCYDALKAVLGEGTVARTWTRNDTYRCTREQIAAFWESLVTDAPELPEAEAEAEAEAEGEVPALAGVL